MIVFNIPTNQVLFDEQHGKLSLTIYEHKPWIGAGNEKEKSIRQHRRQKAL